MPVNTTSTGATYGKSSDPLCPLGFHPQVIKRFLVCFVITYTKLLVQFHVHSPNLNLSLTLNSNKRYDGLRDAKGASATIKNIQMTKIEHGLETALMQRGQMIGDS